MELRQNTASLFLSLLPKPGGRDTAVRVEGQETWLTQALGRVLHTEPALARTVVRFWCGIAVPSDAPVRVVTEQPLRVPRDRQWVSIDMVIAVPGHVVFIENKLDAPLNTYLTHVAGTAEIETQAQRYQRVLDHHRGEDQGHLVILGKQRPPGVETFRTWWELHQLLAEHLASGDERATAGQYLAAQFLQFLGEVNLDPPKALRLGNAFVPRHAHRLLVEVAEVLPDAFEASVRRNGRLTLIHTGCGVAFQKALMSPPQVEVRGRHHEIWLTNGALRISRDTVGLLQTPDLGNMFWLGTIDHQRNVLATVIGDLPKLKPTDGARLTPEEVASRNEDHSKLALRIVEQVEARWGIGPRVGTNKRAVPEITFGLGTGWRLRLRITDKQAYVVFGVGDELVPRVRDELAALVGSQLQVRKHQVNLPLALFSEDQIDAVLDVMAALCPPSKASER